MIFTSSYIDGDHGVSYDRELTGYTYQGQQVELWVTRYSGYEKYDEFDAQIVADDEDCTELAYSGNKRSLYGVLNWARNTLDGRPHVFGETDLRHNKSLAAIHGEGAELYIAGYLMLEFGFIVSLASPNMPSYDLLVVNPQNGKNCKIQVKYRSSRSTSFKFSDVDFDFLVVVDKPKHESIQVNVDCDSKKFRPIAKFDTWVIAQDVVLEHHAKYGYLKNPRKLAHLHDWEKVVEILS